MNSESDFQTGRASALVD